LAKRVARTSGLQGIPRSGYTPVSVRAHRAERERPHILFLWLATSLGHATVFESVQVKIVTTWSGTGEFKSSHVQSLARQCAQFAPGVDFICITNEKVPGVECWPNHSKWPGWYVKFEVFAPWIKGDILYMDLDTVVVGSLENLLQVRKLTLLRDAYRDGKRLTEGLQASLMMLPEKDRAGPWEYFSANPRTYMETYKIKGDQPLLEKYYLSHAQKWQDIVPGQVKSWKVDCGGGNAFTKSFVPADTRLIFFHGKPRPWDCSEWKHLYAV
jgi:hypothetical protein